MNCKGIYVGCLVPVLLAGLASTHVVVAQKLPPRAPREYTAFLHGSWDPSVHGELPLTVFASGRSGNLVWKIVDETPAWCVRPEAKTDQFSFALSSLGVTDTGAMTAVDNNVETRVRDLLFEHLLPTLGAEATLPVLEALLKRTVLVDAEVGPAPKIPEVGEGELGFVACLCWRIPIRDVVRQFDPAMQGRIEWILLRELVPWRAVDTEPEWSAKVPARPGFVRRTATYESTSAKGARLGVVSGARDGMRAHLLQRLQPIVGQATAQKAAAAGVARMAPVRRAFCTEFRRRRPNGRWLSRAFYMHEVPLASVLSALPAKLRGKAAVALRNAR